MKPKFEIASVDLLQFHDDCMKAACECPQYMDEPFSRLDIASGDVDAGQVVEFWAEEEVLWDKGYDECLSVSALAVFDSYKVYRAKLTIWNHEQKAKATNTRKR